MRDSRQFFLIAALSFALAFVSGCSSKKTLNRDEARSDIRSAISFTAEAELFVEFVRGGHATRNYAEGHAAYLDDAVKRSINELQQAEPEPPAEGAVGQCVIQLKRLRRELSGIHSAFGNDAGLAAARDRIGDIRKALERAQSNL
jgi:hypothetical protein